MPWLLTISNIFVNYFAFCCTDITSKMAQGGTITVLTQYIKLPIQSAIYRFRCRKSIYRSHGENYWSVTLSSIITSFKMHVALMSALTGHNPICKHTFKMCLKWGIVGSVSKLDLTNLRFAICSTS